MIRIEDTCLVWPTREACFACEVFHFLEGRPAQPERKSTMNAAKVISFRRDYYTTRLPVKAQWYQCGELGGTCRLTARIIHSAHELSAFQDEVSRRENSGEWIFLVYAEPGAAM